MFTLAAIEHWMLLRYDSLSLRYFFLFFQLYPHIFRVWTSLWHFCHTSIHASTRCWMEKKNSSTILTTFKKKNKQFRISRAIICTLPNTIIMNILYFYVTTCTAFIYHLSVLLNFCVALSGEIITQCFNVVPFVDSK